MRNQLFLDGIWDFAWCGEEKPVLPMEFQEIAPVPGCFDIMEPHCGKRGFALYRRFVTIGGQVKLSIDGLGIQGEVYFDQRKIGECKYAYMPEDFFFDAGEEGVHELCILIDNRYNDVFFPDYDFFAYGGIYGSVTMERIPDYAITRVLISTEDYQTGKIRVRAFAKDSFTGTAVLSFDTGSVGSLSFEQGALDCTLEVPDFKLWDPDHPTLHTLTIKTAADEISETFGIRSVTTEGRRILLNGKPIKLIGYNRHESYPTLGAAVPLGIMASDLKLIKNQGCNFIRGAHYPQRRSLLSLCDRMGLLVWEETLAWGNNAPVLHSPEFREMQLAQARKLTLASHNHPSVILRGFLNENDSTLEETRPLIKALYEEIRSVDPHCLISFSSNKYQREACSDLVDVVSMNPYPGWYDSTYDNISTIHRIKPVLNALSDSISADKPFLITELGAEAIYGFRDPLKTRWSEEYQAELLLEACRYVLESEDCAGISMWHFADARSYVTGPKIYGRARGFNNKGVLDEYRRPKLAWYTLSELLQKK